MSRRCIEMAEVVAVVENGQIHLPPDLHLPDGLEVRVSWADDQTGVAEPYDRRALTLDDIKRDLEWATGQRLSG
jgi:hypothetical protein